MTKQLVAKWRESATLIILAQDKRLPARTGTRFDYRTLLFSRAERASFMPKSSVFPGGVYEPADESPLWLEHFQRFGIGADKLNELSVVRAPPAQAPTIFHKAHGHVLDKEVALRITAIRETFEEVGVLLCRDGNSLGEHNGYGCFNEQFDRVHWQHAIHNDASQFLRLCTEINVVPDLWSLHEWSAWLTPATFKKRFATAFFLVALQETPNLHIEKNEATDFTWKTPEEYLKAYRKKEIFLPPPQFYELARLMNITDTEQLRQFAQRRQANGTTITLPVLFKCLDGVVSVLPGDDCYPADPNASSEPIALQLTVEEFRDGVEKLHRSERINSTRTVLQLNVPFADGQLSPINTI